MTVAKDRRKYTTFIIEYGKCEFPWVSCGIHVAPSYFVLMINETHRGLEF